MCRTALFVAVVLLSVFPRPVWGEELLLRITDPPPDGLVMAHFDLTVAAVQAQIENPQSLDARVEIASGDEPLSKPIPYQFIPSHDDPHERMGTILLRVPKNFSGDVRLVPANSPEREASGDWDGIVKTPFYTVRHDAAQMGGMPAAITFARTGKTFDNFRWNDRLFNPDAGSYTLAGDTNAKIELVSQGPLATVVRTRARYLHGAKIPASKPHAVYDWFYLHDRPLVFVKGQTEQSPAHEWKEIHFLELNYPREKMPRWSGGDSPRQGEFASERKSFGFPDWGAIHDGPNTIAMLHCGQALLYDGGPGTYLQARGDEAWQGFNTTQRGTSAWLWINAAEHAAEAITQAAETLPTSAQVMVTTDRVRDAVAAARKEISKLPGGQRRQEWWRISGAEQLEAAGRFDESQAVAGGTRPDTWTILSAGDLGLILERTKDGLQTFDLFDAAENRHLLTAKSLPLFTINLREISTKVAVMLEADGGWSRCEAISGERGVVGFRWQDPFVGRLRGLHVVAHVTPDPAANALCWSLTVDGVPDGWTLDKVKFPQLAVANPGPGAKVLFPRGCGEVQADVWQRSFRFGGTYPSGWTSMQLMAAYDNRGRSGLYVAAHDPAASTKELLVESRPSDDAVVFSLEHPAPGMGTPQNDFQLGGQVVWQLFRGDWFDAAMIYRDWVRREAHWYPKLGPEGRTDTPLWMRQLPAWGLGGGGPTFVGPSVKRFAEFLDVPVGYHWYSWHQIPFDNDYPHYFPTQEGFAEAVDELQQSGVHVMPYINGRLWDTRDRGLEDFQFTKVARPAATKDAAGEPYVEMYGSKESDDSRVKLAVMCPTTDVWRDKQHEIVMRLMNDCGVQAVYIDQVAAAKPALCLDPKHGHPLGGGHWWTDAYWQLIGRIRQSMPSDRVLTTECNAEPYIHVFDGYLTWHWQYDGQVPVFPAVYGGAIQMFGRAYRGGPTKDLAFKMKAGQQLVFGEQIGWCNTGVVDEEENAAFLRQVVHLRNKLGRYFYAGEMARPPKLIGKIPRVTADWQWSGIWPVTTDAVMTGAWQIPRERRAVLLFVNVSDQPVRATIDFNAADYALPDGNLRATKVTADGRGESFPLPRATRRECEFPPRTAWVWEITNPSRRDDRK